MAKRRPVGTSLTWGEAMVASVYTFFLMFWAYGVIPHLWLTWADNELKWRPDNILIKAQSAGGWSPITISYQTVRDLLAVGIYVVFLGVNIALWAYWQGRGERAKAASTVLDTSDFGRPLVKQA
jgi:hypothetical protein